MKPLWYSYFFIATDVISLLIQAGGGGAASVASNNHTDTRPGTNTMIAGIVTQVFAMTVFLVFWFEFLARIYFKIQESNQQTVHWPEEQLAIISSFYLMSNQFVNTDITIWRNSTTRNML